MLNSDNFLFVVVVGSKWNACLKYYETLYNSTSCKYALRYSRFELNFRKTSGKN